jgi:small GTP-binding protein
MVSVECGRYMRLCRDTAGQEEYAPLLKMSFPNTDVFLVCFSVDHRDSFENMQKKWVPDLQLHAKGGAIVIVGTKIDQRARGVPCVSLEEAKQVVEGLGYNYMECSALTGEGLKEIFETSIRLVLKKRRRRELPQSSQCLTQFKCNLF